MNTLARRSIAALIFSFGLLASNAALAANAKLVVVVSSTSFAWLPLYVADGAGLFREEGVDVEISVVKDGAVVLSAIMSGDADIAGIGANSAFAARSRNQPIRMLVPMNTEFTSTLFGRKDVFAAKGITDASPLKEKVEALKGLKIGVVNINAGAHLLFRFLMQRYGNADLDKVSVVTPVGDAPPTLAAMSKGLIDVTAFSPPIPQKAISDGYAMILIDPIRGDIPETRGMVFTALAITESAMVQKAQSLEAFTRAIDRANRLAQSDPRKAGDAARRHFSAMQEDLYREGVLALLPAIPKSPEVSIPGLKAYYEVLRMGGEKYAQGDFDFEASTANDLVRRAMTKK